MKSVLIRRLRSQRARWRDRAVGLTLGLVLALSGLGSGSRPAQALDRDVKAVMVVGAYGAIGGTVLGLAALPFNKSIRTVFIGTSVGLYLGIAIGLYYVYDRHQNEQRMYLRPRRTERDGKDVDGELRGLASARTLSDFELSPTAQPLRLDVPVLKF